MNIVIIPAFFQTKKHPTFGSFFFDQAKALQRKGHKVSILYCDTYSLKCVGEWVQYMEEPVTVQEGIKIYRNKSFCLAKHGIEGYHEEFARGILQLFHTHFKGGNVDIIHAHCCVWAGYAAMKLSEKIHVPYVITEHATLFQLHKESISKANNKLIGKVFEKAASVICVSRAFRELLSEYRNEIFVVGNVVDCKRFQVQSIPNKSNIFQFLTICYMEEEAMLYKKGIDVLLQAWKQLISIQPQARLIIGGGGRARKKVVEWIEEYNIQDSVELLGHLSREQVVEQMQKCDCFVLPSRYETFGVVYIEAMACGKPVIAVKNGGPDDFIKEFNGLLVGVEQIDELTVAMKQMIQDRAMYKPKRISEFVHENFSEQAIASQLEMIYQQIIG